MAPAKTSLTPTQRKLRAQLAAHTPWAGTADTTAATAAARDKFAQRFDDQVDPQRQLDPAERARRAAHARSAYFKALALARSEEGIRIEAPMSWGAAPSPPD
jgi:hypothetical protein